MAGFMPCLAWMPSRLVGARIGHGSVGGGCGCGGVRGAPSASVVLDEQPSVLLPARLADGEAAQREAGRRRGGVGPGAVGHGVADGGDRRL